MSAPKTWAEMRTMMERLLIERSGEDVEVWNTRIAAAPAVRPHPADHARPRRKPVTGGAFLRRVLVTQAYSPGWVTRGEGAGLVLSSQSCNAPR
jgi:hypothetical protein